MLGRDIWCSLKTPFLLLLAVNIASIYERKLNRIWYYLRCLISLSISWEFRSKNLLWNKRTFVLAVLYICFCWIILKFFHQKERYIRLRAWAHLCFVNELWMFKLIWGEKNSVSKSGFNKWFMNDVGRFWLCELKLGGKT